MRGLWFYPLALMSLSYGAVDSNKIFTQDTTLDSSYANITSTPASGEELIWGEIRGGDESTPITLGTSAPLNISSIQYSGGVVGIEVAYKSHGLLKGDLTFSSLSSSDNVTGILGRGMESLSNEGNLSFKQITSSSAVAMGFLGTSLYQKGSLSFASIESSKGYGLGALAFYLANFNKSSILLDSISAKNAGGLVSLFLGNEGSIQINTLEGQESVVGIGAVLQNAGKVNISSIDSQGYAFGFVGSIINQGSITLDSISGVQDVVGIEAGIENKWSIEVKKVQSSNRAVGIGGGDSVTNSGSIVFGDIFGEKVALGAYVHDFSNDGSIVFSSITSNELAIGVRGGVGGNGGGKITFSKISAPKAIGMYGGGGWSNGKGSIVFESILGAQSYGIFLEDKNRIYNFSDKEDMLFHFKNIQSNIGIYNLSGRMDVSGGARFVFGANVPAQTLSTIYSDINQGKYYLNDSRIDSPYQYAFYANQDADVYVASSKTLQMDAKQYSFGGKSNLHLDANARLILDTGGTLQTLQANQAQITLNHSSPSARLTINSFQSQNSNFVMNVDLDSTRSGSYDGGAFYDESKNTIQEGKGAFLQIDSSNTKIQVNNTLSVDLKSKTNTAQKYVVLAQVHGANRDNVIFNSLSDRQTIAITPSAGYQTNELLLGRYDDDSVTQSNYYYLIANPFEIQDPTPPKPADPAPQEKGTRNSLIYSPSQSILLSTFDWGKTRFAKLRSDNRSSRIWAELGAKYWTYNSDELCNEAFVDFLVGGDYLFSFAKGRNVLGLAVGVTGGFIEQNQTLGKMENVFNINSTYTSLSLYDVLMLDNGVYSHTIFRVGGGGSEFAEESFMGESSKEEGMIYAFSEKVGKRFYFSSNEGVFTDLSAMVAVGYVEDSSLYQGNQGAPWEIAQFTQISSFSSFLNQNKIELLLGYQSAFNSFFSFDLSAGVGFVSNHCIGGGMTYENQNGIWEFESTPYVGALELSVNLVVRMGDWIDAYANVSSAWSKQYNEVIDFSAGIRLRFGTL